MNSRVTAVLRRPASISSEISAPASRPIANSRSPVPIAAANASAAGPVENRKPYGRRHHMSWPFDIRVRDALDLLALLAAPGDRRRKPSPQRRAKLDKRRINAGVDADLPRHSTVER